MSTLHGSDHDIDVAGDFALKTCSGSAHPDTVAGICADTASIHADAARICAHTASMSADSAHESAVAALKAASAVSWMQNTVIWFVVGIIAGLVMALVMIVLVDAIVTVDLPVAESPVVAVEFAGTLRA